MNMKSAYKLTLLFSIFLLLVTAAHAQFNSGSTGADGALDLATMSCPQGVCIVQLPQSGVLNYTTINIPGGTHLYFRTNSRNTSAILLAQGAVSVNGTISVSNPCGPGGHLGICVDSRNAGPGGFPGGYPPGNVTPGGDGFGPGAGTVASPQARWVGPLSLSPIVGGSGGAGHVCGFSCLAPGGGGGGAIVIATSGAFSMGSSGGIAANGHRIGSGGAIRIVANAITVNNATLFACDEGYLANQNNTPYCGVIRLEALQGQVNYQGVSRPLSTIVEFTNANPPVVVTNNRPTLSIVAVGGFSVPFYAGQRFNAIDILLPSQLVDPISVAAQAVNIPVGTQVNVGFVSGPGTSTPCNLAGTFASSSCTATISNLNRTGGTYLLATAAFDPPASVAGFNPKGKDHVAKVKLESVYGGTQKYMFLRADGSVIDLARLSKKFLQEFGM